MFDYSGYVLSQTAFNNFLSKIPPNETGLSFKAKLLSYLDIMELCFYMSRIPKKINKLDLTDNEFGNKSKDYIIAMLMSINPSVTELVFDNNSLDCFNDEELAEIFQAFPRNLLKLSIRNNNLGKYSTAALQNAFKRLPPDLITLDIGDNNLGTILMSTVRENLPEVLTSLPVKIQFLTLQNNYLFVLSEENICTSLKVLHKSIVSLDLSTNNFGMNPINYMQSLLSSIDPNVTELCFGNNMLDELTDDELIELFAAFPRNLKRLSLSDNNLDKFSAEVLGKAFAKLPPGLKDLDMSGNGFGVKPLKLAFSKLSMQLDSLNLSYNSFTQMVDDIEHPSDDAVAIITVMQPVKKITIEEDFSLESTHFLTYHLLDILKEIIFTDKVKPALLKQKFNHFELNDRLQAELIHKEYPSYLHLNHLMKGLLLNFTIGNQDCYSTDTDEKRIVDAINYFIKAAEDPKIKPYVDYLLWEIKKANIISSSKEKRERVKYNSIEQKLERLNLIPPENDPIKHVVKIQHYLEEYSFFKEMEGKEKTEDGLPSIQMFF